MKRKHQGDVKGEPFTKKRKIVDVDEQSQRKHFINQTLKIIKSDLDKKNVEKTKELMQKDEIGCSHDDRSFIETNYAEKLSVDEAFEEHGFLIFDNLPNVRKDVYSVKKMELAVMFKTCMEWNLDDETKYELCYVAEKRFGIWNEKDKRFMKQLIGKKELKIDHKHFMFEPYKTLKDYEKMINDKDESFYLYSYGVDSYVEPGELLGGRHSFEIYVVTKKK